MKHLLLLFALLLVSLPVQATKPDTYTIEFPDLPMKSLIVAILVFGTTRGSSEKSRISTTKTGTSFVREMNITAFDDLYRRLMNVEVPSPHRNGTYQCAGFIRRER